VRSYSPRARKGTGVGRTKMFMTAGSHAVAKTRVVLQLVCTGFQVCQDLPKPEELK